MTPEPTTDLDWMALQVAALFVSDDNGRLLRPNQPGQEHLPPPRFFLGRTPHGALWRFGTGLPHARTVELARLAGAERAARPLEAGPERREPMRASLERDSPIEFTFHGPAFRFPPLDSLPGPGLMTVTPDRVGLLEAHFPGYIETFPTGQPYVVSVEGGAAVAICHCATGQGRAVEAGVETAPGWRRRGLALQVVAGWARAIAREGRLPLYSTTWENTASRGVARRLGLILYGADLHFR